MFLANLGNGLLTVFKIFLWPFLCGDVVYSDHSEGCEALRVSAFGFQSFLGHGFGIPLFGASAASPAGSSLEGRIRRGLRGSKCCKP